ncbi:MAG: FecR domain-containing protein [Burkholderiales bacterium]|nr:FecR domain-containing protein [Burkholderiales bacterium]
MQAIAAFAIAIFCLAGAASAQVAQVVESKGASLVERAGAAPRILGAGERLDARDTIRVARDSWVLLEFGDRTRVTLRPDTVFRINAYSEGAPESMLMGLVKGGLRALTGRIGQRNPSAVKFQTATATIGIRGTEFDARLCEGDCAMAEKRFEARRSDFAARVVDLEPGVVIVGASGSIRRPVAGSYVYEGEGIVTGTRAVAALSLRDGGVIALHPSTHLRVLRFQFDAGDPGRGGAQFNLRRGRVESKTGSLGKNRKGGYVFATSNASVVTRGTTFTFGCVGVCVAPVVDPSDIAPSVLTQYLNSLIPPGSIRGVASSGFAGYQAAALPDPATYAQVLEFVRIGRYQGPATITQNPMLLHLQDRVGAVARVIENLMGLTSYSFSQAEGLVWPPLNTWLPGEVADLLQGLGAASATAAPAAVGGSTIAASPSAELIALVRQLYPSGSLVLPDGRTVNLGAPPQLSGDATIAEVVAALQAALGVTQRYPGAFPPLLVSKLTGALLALDRLDGAFQEADTQAALSALRATSVAVSPSPPVPAESAEGTSQQSSGDAPIPVEEGTSVTSTETGLQVSASEGRVEVSLAPGTRFLVTARTLPEVLSAPLRSRLDAAMTQTEGSKAGEKLDPSRAESALYVWVRDGAVNLTKDVKSVVPAMSAPPATTTPPEMPAPPEARSVSGRQTLPFAQPAAPAADPPPVPRMLRWDLRSWADELEDTATRKFSISSDRARFSLPDKDRLFGPMSLAELRSFLEGWRFRLEDWDSGVQLRSLPPVESLTYEALLQKLNEWRERLMESWGYSGPGSSQVANLRILQTLDYYFWESTASVEVSAGNAASATENGVGLLSEVPNFMRFDPTPRPQPSGGSTSIDVFAAADGSVFGSCKVR